MTIPTQSNRIEWIDTAKGICISLVVLQHISNYVVIDYFMEYDFLTFRMPLYFILSGLFFKTYEGFVGFFVRKTNKLLIPYIFFYVVFGVVIPVSLNRFIGYQISSRLDYGFSGIRHIFSERRIFNNYIWFLFSLFEVNLLFYLLKMVSDKFRKSTIVLIVFSGFCGVLGMLLSVFSINLPYYLDTSLSSLPFFAFGYFLNRHTGFMGMESNRKTNLLSCVFIVVVFSLIHFLNEGELSLIDNTFGKGIWAFVQVYPYGILGTLSVLVAARFLGPVPVVSYLGRYSLIVLCTHGYVIKLIGDMIGVWITCKTILFIVLFLLTIVVEIGVVWVFKSYLGYFTAQKDLIIVPESGKQIE